jgi:hypothetical protein
MSMNIDTLIDLTFGMVVVLILGYYLYSLEALLA